eukprot:7237280-Pyramimonas_sp.AAC.1
MGLCPPRTWGVRLSPRSGGKDGDFGNVVHRRAAHGDQQGLVALASAMTRQVDPEPGRPPCNR